LVRCAGNNLYSRKDTGYASGNITAEFMKAYFDALATLDGVKAPPKTPREKTFFWLVDQYFRSPVFNRYDHSQPNQTSAAS
jgi:hypothetical protein